MTTLARNVSSQYGENEPKATEQNESILPYQPIARNSQEQDTPRPTPKHCQNGWHYAERGVGEALEKLAGQNKGIELATLRSIYYVLTDKASQQRSTNRVRISYTELGKSAGVSRITAIRYIKVLTQGRLITPLHQNDTQINSYLLNQVASITSDTSKDMKVSVMGDTSIMDDTSRYPTNIIHDTSKASTGVMDDTSNILQSRSVTVSEPPLRIESRIDSKEDSSNRTAIRFSIKRICRQLGREATGKDVHDAYELFDQVKEKGLDNYLNLLEEAQKITKGSRTKPNNPIAYFFTVGQNIINEMLAQPPDVWDQEAKTEKEQTTYPMTTNVSTLEEETKTYPTGVTSSIGEEGISSQVAAKECEEVDAREKKSPPQTWTVKNPQKEMVLTTGEHDEINKSNLQTTQLQEKKEEESPAIENRFQGLFKWAQEETIGEPGMTRLKMRINSIKLVSVEDGVWIIGPIFGAEIAEYDLLWLKAFRRALGPVCKELRAGTISLV